MWRHLSYADAVATLALFLALGGTGYAAVALPRNSVGTAEIRDGSIRSRDIRDGSLRRRDLAARLRSAPVLRAMVTRAGALAGGEASSAERAGPGVYRVRFGPRVAGCAFAATLAAGVNSDGADIGSAGRITVESRYPARVAVVRTYDAAGVAADEPFQLVVACSPGAG
jgi:hypothetical protein